MYFALSNPSTSTFHPLGEMYIKNAWKWTFERFCISIFILERETKWSSSTKTLCRSFRQVKWGGNINPRGEEDGTMNYWWQITERWLWINGINHSFPICRIGACRCRHSDIQITTLLEFFFFFSFHHIQGISARRQRSKQERRERQFSGNLNRIIDRHGIHARNFWVWLWAFYEFDMRHKRQTI